MKRHGRTTTGNPSVYIRMKPSEMEKMKENLKTSRPTDVYNLNDSFEGPRNKRQVTNAKSRMTKADKFGTAVHSANFADQIACVEEMQHHQPFIQQIICQSGKVPCVILYSQEQIEDLKRFCCPPPSADCTILGVD